MHFANFRIRKIVIRLPAGLPFAKAVWLQHIGIGELSWKQDSKGKGGILPLAPSHEPGELQEIRSPDEVVEIRSRLLAGAPSGTAVVYQRSRDEAVMSSG